MPGTFTCTLRSACTWSGELSDPLEVERRLRRPLCHLSPRGLSLWPHSADQNSITLAVVMHYGMTLQYLYSQYQCRPHPTRGVYSYCQFGQVSSTGSASVEVLGSLAAQHSVFTLTVCAVVRSPMGFDEGDVHVRGELEGDEMDEGACTRARAHRCGPSPRQQPFARTGGQDA